VVDCNRGPEQALDRAAVVNDGAGLVNGESGVVEPQSVVPRKRPADPWRPSKLSR
jgi:hypothetical protein